VLEAFEGARAEARRAAALLGVAAGVGNLSSASVLFVLGDLLDSGEAKPGDYGLLMAMGPGFCAELVLLRVVTSPRCTRAVIALVGVERLVELRLSRRNAQRAFARGRSRWAGHYRVMTVLPHAFLVSCGAEPWLLDRRRCRGLSSVMGGAAGAGAGAALLGHQDARRALEHPHHRAARGPAR
jgi:hypothetical protein